MDEETKALVEELIFSGKEKPSFVKWLYFGVFDEERVIPFPTPSEEEKKAADTLVKKVEAFMDKELDPKAIDKAGEISKKVIDGLGELGILSLTIPKEYGGLGLSQYTYCRVMETIARRCSATALFINAHQSIGMKALLLFGTDIQKDKWLKSLSTGEKLAAFSLTEPNAGSDAAGIETKAEYDADKKVYRINGKKQWTTNGSIASILTVMAKVDGKVTAFLVTPDLPGFKVTAKALDKVGMRGSTTSNLAFENMEVPETQILGPLGGGLRVCLTVLDYGRTTFGATCTGMAQECVKRVFKYSEERIQFKKPLKEFALVRQKLRDMAANLYAMEATTYLTAGLVDKGNDDFMLESACLKVFASEASWQILYDTMQIFGGKSFFTDLPFERMMRDARLNMIGEGSNEVLRVFIAAIGLRDVGMGLKGVKDALFHPINEQKKLKDFLRLSRHYFIKTPITLHNRKLAKEGHQLAGFIRRFGVACTRVLAWYGEGIVEKQLELNRIATIAIGLYTSSAVLSKMDAEGVSDDGVLYLALARETMNRAFQNLYSTLDSFYE
ncbi:MAG: acyl-CoA dehydrogenase family protein [Chlamydiia bacterium]|nr:acyl-CoA dehydrogenase family protein [Chlamydiia bacterium]